MAKVDIRSAWLRPKLPARLTFTRPRSEFLPANDEPVIANLNKETGLKVAFSFEEFANGLNAYATDADICSPSRLAGDIWST